jgi:hypothetical protein
MDCMRERSHALISPSEKPHTVLCGFLFFRQPLVLNLTAHASAQTACQTS